MRGLVLGLGITLALFLLTGTSHAGQVTGWLWCWWAAAG